MNLEEYSDWLNTFIFIGVTAVSYIGFAAISNQINGYDQLVADATLWRSLVAGFSGGVAHILLS